MKSLSLIIQKNKRALYLRIADAIREAIRQGRLRPGEVLPSSRDLAESLQAHRETVMNALGELVAEGWLEAEERRSYHVCQRLPDDLVRAAMAITVGHRRSTRPFNWKVVRDFRLERRPELASIKHSFRTHPDLRLFPFSEFKASLWASLKRSRSELFGYGDPAGHPALIKEIESYLRRVRALTGRRILMTHGSQEAISLVAQLLISPGDHAAIESPGYPPATAAFECAGACVVPVPVDEQGVDPAALLKLAKGRRLRIVYLTPLHQYPTTVTIPIARRMEIYRIAAQYGIAILEDDYDHEFHYRSQPLAPLASDDPCGLVIYTSSFSKVLFPSARIGFLAVPEALYEPLRGIRRIISQQNDHLTQDALARWMRAGGFERHLRRMRRVYEERCGAMAEALEFHRNRGRKIDWLSPDGGMAMWVKFPKNARRISHQAALLGVSAPADEEFERYQNESNHLRLGFSMQTPEELRRGIDLLMRALDRA